MEHIVRNPVFPSPVVLTIKARMINILNAAVKTTAWEGSDGIITEGVSTTSNNDGVGFKGNHSTKLPYL